MPSSGDFPATTEIWQGNQLNSRNSTVFEDKAKVNGEVGTDAKLKFVEVEHSQAVLIVASGGIVIRSEVTRKVRIDMPGGKYDPDSATVRYSETAWRRLGSQRLRQHRRGGDQELPRSRAPLEHLRPPVLREPVFAPETDTLKLKKGDKKQLSIYAKAKDGGRATGARWTLLNPSNADFSPTASQDPAPTVSYTVSNTPRGGEVKVTVKFTSTAGVGENTWTQQTEQESINHLSGNFSGEISISTSAGPSVHSWSGGATLDRTTPDVIGGPNGAYSLSAGSVTYHLSGIEGLISACHWSGTAVIGLPHPGGGSGSATVFGTPPEFMAPYEYSIQVITPPPPAAEIEFTRSNCPEGADELEDTKEKIPFLVEFDTGLQQSEDGIHFAGSTEKKEGGVTLKQSWVFEGTP